MAPPVTHAHCVRQSRADRCDPDAATEMRQEMYVAEVSGAQRHCYPVRGFAQPQVFQMAIAAGFCPAFALKTTACADAAQGYPARPQRLRTAQACPQIM